LHCRSKKDSVAGPKYGLLIAITLSEMALIALLAPLPVNASLRRPRNMWTSFRSI
jgi:hypothetical protein